MAEHDRDLQNRIFMEIQMTLTGHPVGEAYTALNDAMAMMIAVVATDRANADVLIDALPDDIRSLVDLNWEEARKHHAKMLVVASGAGHG